MLGNQESQGEPQDQLASHLEPDQEVAAVLGKEANFPQSGLPASVKRGSRSSSTKELTTGVKLEQEVKESLSNGDTAAQCKLDKIFLYKLCDHNEQHNVTAQNCLLSFRSL